MKLLAYLYYCDPCCGRVVIGWHITILFVSVLLYFAQRLLESEAWGVMGMLTLVYRLRSSFSTAN